MYLDGTVYRCTLLVATVRNVDTQEMSDSSNPIRNGMIGADQCWYTEMTVTVFMARLVFLPLLLKDDVGLPRSTRKVSRVSDL